tara:strand:- start:3235 stop:3720 length:486 start_codon:yes stop_codon:yes gene_type:complete
MKKVLYLHGLESGQGGSKVDYLADNCYVHAPEMDYTRKDIFPYLVQIMEDFNPDLIIGSSMGGYAAYMLSGFYGTPIIAFNPALHSRKFNPKFPNKVQTYYPGKAKIILGEEDTIIDPKTTLKFIADHIGNGFPQIDIDKVDGMGHRVPLDIFISKIKYEL